MNSVMIGIQGFRYLFYLDDIMIYGPNLKEHNKWLNDIFQRLRHNKLKLQPDKYKFLRKEITYLGHIITKKGIQSDPAKLQAIFLQKIFLYLKE